ncbi:MAG: sensor histidine kinase, partial [Bacteroidota bacterium]
MAHSSYLKLNTHTIKLLILIGMIPPLYFQLSHFVEYEINQIKSWGNFFFWTGISVGITILLAIIVLQEIKWIDKKLPWSKSVAWRIIVELFITNATVLSAMAILARFSYRWHCQFFPEQISFRTHLLQELTVGVVLLTIMIGITEGTYFFREWKKSLLLAEKLKKEALEAQLESLKNQVNPHFLFNSLNVLSTLVHKDADRAEEFIDQFAAVYRYVLNIQDKQAVTLGEELEFLNSYIFL